MSSTDLSSIKLVMTTSAFAAAFWTVDSARAPSATSGAVFDAVLFQTVRSWPDLQMHWAIPVPMFPKPMNAICIFHSSCSILTRLGEEADGAIPSTPIMVEHLPLD